MDKSSKSEDLLSQVREGMVVYDINKERVGTISDIYLGAANDSQESGTYAATPKRDDMSTLPGLNIVNTLLPVSIPLTAPNDPNAPIGESSSLTLADRLPESVRARLLEQGYIRVPGDGLLPDVYYVTPDQLASLNSKDVFLSVTRQQLVTNR